VLHGEHFVEDELPHLPEALPHRHHIGPVHHPLRVRKEAVYSCFRWAPLRGK
jgi:hypothetical protein